MDQQQHMTKTEAHPYHRGPQAIRTHSDGRAYDPLCPLCRECALPPVSDAVEREAYARYPKGAPPVPSDMSPERRAEIAKTDADAPSLEVSAVRAKLATVGDLVRDVYVMGYNQRDDSQFRVIDVYEWDGCAIIHADFTERNAEDDEQAAEIVRLLTALDAAEARARGSEEELARLRPKPPERPMCSACGELPGSERGSGQHSLVGASLCKDCFIEWYDGDRPGAGTDAENTPEKIGAWVRQKRAKFGSGFNDLMPSARSALAAPAAPAPDDAREGGR